VIFIRSVLYLLPGLCGRCRCTPAETMSGLLSQVRTSEKRLQTVHNVCTACTRSEPLEPVRCVSLDCPWFFQRKKVEQQAEDIEILQELVQGMEMGSETLPESRHDLEEPQEDGDEKPNTTLVMGMTKTEVTEPYRYDTDSEAEVELSRY